MTMDKLFDGSDAHLLPGNAELIQQLRDYINNTNDCPLRKEAADALEAADKRIAELEAAIVGWRADQKENIATAVEECKRANEAERKLTVAREALKNLFLSSPITLECNDMHHAKKDQHEYDEDCPVLSRYEDALSGAREALAQIGGDDAR